MGFITSIVNGDSFDTTVIRREKTSNGFKNVKDKATEIQDPDTGETLLKFKSDGLKVPKPDNQQFETLWYRDKLDKLTGSKSHTDFIEIFLREKGDSADGDFVEFNPDLEKQLQLSGSQAQFQTHRDLEAEKTLDIFSTDDNQQLYMLATFGIMVIVMLGGQWIVIQGVQESVVEGVKQGFQTVQSTANNAEEATGMIPVFAFMGRQKFSSIFSKLKNLLKSDKQ